VQEQVEQMVARRPGGSTIADDCHSGSQRLGSGVRDRPIVAMVRGIDGRTENQANQEHQKQPKTRCYDVRSL